MTKKTKKPQPKQKSLSALFSALMSTNSFYKDLAQLSNHSWILQRFFYVSFSGAGGGWADTDSLWWQSFLS